MVDLIRCKETLRRAQIDGGRIATIQRDQEPHVGFEVVLADALPLLQSFRVLAERRVNARGQLIALSEATVKLDIGGRRAMEVGEGNGPVNALDAALRKALIPVYPTLTDMRLVDFKVRILDSAGGTAATTRVMIESADSKGRWSTIGVSPNIVDASYNALYDAITYKLFRDGAKLAERT